MTISEFGPPKAPGVYAVCARLMRHRHEAQGAEHVLYVGSSQNIFKRVMNDRHPYRMIYDRFSLPILVYTRHMVTDDYRSAEVQAIRTLRPRFNIQHRNG